MAVEIKRPVGRAAPSPKASKAGGDVDVSLALGQATPEREAQVRQKFTHGRTKAIAVEVKKPVQPALVSALTQASSAEDGRRSLVLGRAAQSGDAQVRQKFSHGRTRVVTVEAKKPIPPSGIVLKLLSEEEKQARAKALAEAKRDAELARQRAEAARQEADNAAGQPVTKADARPSRIIITKRIYVRDRRLALEQIRTLLTAFEEVVEYNPQRHHNQPPPALWIDDADSLKSYLKDVKELVSELKQLNDCLKKSPEITAEKPAESASIVKNACKKFVDSYAENLGKGAAALSVAVVTALLYNLHIK